ncbi:hypothetical protein DFH06DRAFT_1437642 [Mycena polygramma]|nr:hypothetical protein DFH06DRAFT_1437642 [Mycena polygramma]
MPRPGILLGAIPVTLLGTLYYQHWRLQSKYPTLRVPPALEISARSDTPAFGMTGHNDPSLNPNTNGTGEPWLRTNAGDMWAVTVPRRLVSSTNDGALVEFARAFWSSWPLRIERRIVVTLARAGILFHTRTGENVGDEGKRQFTKTAPILDGLFIVEAHDATTKTAAGVLNGPIVASWWLRPQEGSDTNKQVGLLGGYHSFAVEDPNPESESVRLCFVSHLILSESAPPPNAEGSLPTDALHVLNFRQRLIMHFHTLYSRILLDLAVRGLETRARA